MSEFDFEEENFSSMKLDMKVWKKIFGFMKPLKKYVILGILAIGVLAVTDIIYPYIAKFAIDDIITPNIGVIDPDMSKLKLFIGFYVMFMIIQAIMVYLFIIFAGKVQVELAFNIRKKAFRHLQELPFSYYDRTRTGWIMARMTSDSRNLSDILSWGIVDLSWSIILMVFLVIFMFILKWQLALVAIAIVPLLILVSSYFRRHILKSYRSIRKVNSKITGAFNEGLTGAITTKTLVLEDANFGDFDNLTSDMRRQSIRAAMFHGLYFPTVIFLIAIGIALVYYQGGRMVLLDAISVGTLYLFSSYVWQFFDPVNNIVSIYAQFQQAQASAERIVSLIETKPDISDTEAVVEKYGTLFDYKLENFEPLKGDVEFQNVSFKYHVGEQVLTDFSLKVGAGQSIAL
ncbi:MAG: ABC transporter transmembrane domain-containing protein, partial [Candidatus Izemoplasmatales bacterium]|nr:ABC transporter transmembrane domain-containing protein [Candidatus Izemoplasmatales bacterium]